MVLSQLDLADFKFSNLKTLLSSTTNNFCNSHHEQVDPKKLKGEFSLVFASYLLSLCVVIKKNSKKYFKDESFLLKIGENIRAIRIAQGFSIERLANDCGIDYSQLGRMELGKVNFTVSFLSKISKALDIDPRELLP